MALIQANTDDFVDKEFEALGSRPVNKPRNVNFSDIAVRFGYPRDMGKDGLVPERRRDRNGVLVTRWVKPGAGATPSRPKLPEPKTIEAPSLESTSGLRWNHSVEISPEVNSVKRAVFRFMKTQPEFVYDAAALENLNFTVPEVMTILDGVTVGGRKLDEQNVVAALGQSNRLLASKVTDGSFALGKRDSDAIHAVLARFEALESGNFRGEGDEHNFSARVHLGDGDYHEAPRTEKGGANLLAIYERGLNEIMASSDNPMTQAQLYFLFAATNQFYFDGNKRTGRAMMNGHLMSHGIDAISIPASRRLEFNTKMVAFYRSSEATEMMEFLNSCYLDAR